MLFINLNNYSLRSRVSLLTEKSPLTTFIVARLVDCHLFLYDVLSDLKGVLDGLNNFCKNSY